MKLKEQNNSVFGIAILETRPDYNLWRAAVCCYHM